MSILNLRMIFTKISTANLMVKNGCPLLSLLFSIILEVLAVVIARIRNKRHVNWKKKKTVPTGR